MFTYTKAIKTLVIITTLASASVYSDENNSQRVPTTKTEAITLDLYKSPTCGCCGKWASHIKENKLKIMTHNRYNISAIKTEKGVPLRYQSCHTSISKDGFVFEGHIPAKYILQFLNDKPVDAIGLTVPGMPIGTPGMKSGDKFTPYEILQLNKDGHVSVYTKVNSIEEQF